MIDGRFAVALAARLFFSSAAAVMRQVHGKRAMVRVMG